jgi:hypothetical protein
MTTTSATKTKALCVATRCADVDQFIATYHKFCDDTSFFVATHNSRPLGLETAFSIQLADSTPVLRGLCVVVEAWTTASNPFNRPGIRLGIRRLTADSVDVFTRLVRAARETPRDEASVPISVPTPAPTLPPVPAAAGRPPTLPPPLVRTDPVDVPLPPPTPSILVAAAAPAGATETAASPAPEAAAAPGIPTREPSAPAAVSLSQSSRTPAPEEEPTLTTAPASPSPPVPGPPRPRAATPPPVPGSLPPRNVKPPPATPAIHSLPPTPPPLQPLRSGSAGTSTSTPARGVLSLAAPKAALGSSVPRPGGVVSSPPASSPLSMATSPVATAGPVSTPSSSSELEAAWESASATLDLPVTARPPVAAPASPATEPLASPPGQIPTPPVLPRLARAEPQLPSTPTLIPRSRPISEPTDPDLASSLAGPAQADPEAPASGQSPPPETADKLAGLSKISSVTPLSATAFAAALSSTPPRAGAPGSSSESTGTVTGHAYRERPPDERETGPAAPPPPETPAETSDPIRTGTRRQTPAVATPAVATPPLSRRVPSEPALPTVAARPAVGSRRVPSEPAAGSRRPPSDPATDAEARTPGSDFVLPANPLSNLTDDQLEGFIDCTLYEEASNFHDSEGSIDIRDLMPATRERPPASEQFAYTDVRRPFRTSTGQFIPIEGDSQIPGGPVTPSRPFAAEQRRRETPPPVSLSPTVEVELDAFANEPGVTHATAANVRQSALAMQAAESRPAAPGFPGMPGGDAMHPAGMANGMTTPFPGSLAAPVYLPPTAYGAAATGRPNWRQWALIGLSAMIALVILVVVIKVSRSPRAPEGGSPATGDKAVAGTQEPKQDRGTTGPDHPGAGAVTSGSAGGTGSATPGTPLVGSPPGAGSSAAGIGPGPGSAAVGVGPGSAAVGVGPGSAVAGSGSGSARAPDPPGGPSVAGGPPTFGSGPCRISITANLAGAAVKVDGQSVGVSPMTLDGPCQARRVELSHPRYVTITRVVTPALDKPESLEITLTRPMHRLNVASTPPGATIFIDGRRVGTSPATVQVPGFTIVRITIDKAGYKTVTQRYYSKVLQDRLTVRMLESFGFGGK